VKPFGHGSSNLEREECRGDLSERNGHGKNVGGESDEVRVQDQQIEKFGECQSEDPGDGKRNILRKVWELSIWDPFGQKGGKDRKRFIHLGFRELLERGGKPTTSRVKTPNPGGKIVAGRRESPCSKKWRGPFKKGQLFCAGKGRTLKRRGRGAASKKVSLGNQMLDRLNRQSTDRKRTEEGKRASIGEGYAGF